MFQTGNLRATFTWDGEPNVKVIRNGVVVGLAELSVEYGLMNAEELVPMDPPEWEFVKDKAIAWMKENPKPPPAA